MWIAETGSQLSSSRTFVTKTQGLSWRRYRTTTPWSVRAHKGEEFLWIVFIFQCYDAHLTRCVGGRFIGSIQKHIRYEWRCNRRPEKLSIIRTCPVVVCRYPEKSRSMFESFICFHKVDRIRYRFLSGFYEMNIRWWCNGNNEFISISNHAPSRPCDSFHGPANSINGAFAWNKQRLLSKIKSNQIHVVRSTCPYLFLRVRHRSLAFFKSNLYFSGSDFLRCR